MNSPLHAYWGVFRLPGIGGLLLAACLSRLAGRMFLLAIVLYALERFHSPTLTGWLAFAALAPGFAVSPLAGALLDRSGAAWGILIDSIVSAGLLLTLVIIDKADIRSTPLLFTIVALYSLTTPLSVAGVRTMIPRLVPEPMRDRANALDTTIFALTDIVGPALAGALLGFAGSQVTLLVIVACFFASIIGLHPVFKIARESAGIRRSLLSDSLAGIRYVLANSTLRGLAIAYSLYQMSWGALIVLVPVIVERKLGPGPTDDTVVGALWAGAGIAGAIGALITGHMRTEDRERALIVAGILATALAIFPFCALFGLLGLVAGMAVVGFAAGPIDVGVLSVRQRRTDSVLLGRALAVSMGLNMSGLPIGSALGGWIAGWSVQWAFAAAGLAACAGALAAYALVPRRRI